MSREIRKDRRRTKFLQPAYDAGQIKLVLYHRMVEHVHRFEEDDAPLGHRIDIQIVYMDERFRGADDFSVPGRMVIHSDSCPELDEDSLFLQGTHRARDHEIASYWFSRITDADDYLERAFEVLDLWAQEWRGWNLPSKLQQLPSLKEFPSTREVGGSLWFRQVFP